MAFRPSMHGWPFPNAYSCPPSGLGIGAPALPELGLGGGMCWAALDRYVGGVAIRRGTAAPEEGDPLHTELVRRQVASVAGTWRRVREWQALPSDTWRDRFPAFPRPGGSLAGRSRAEWSRIRKLLDGGQPVLLTLLADADPYSRPRAAWQVLATGYTRRSGRVTVSVYDPASPNDDDVRLGFSTSGELDAQLTGGRSVRGFFRVPYDRAPSRALRAESFADRSVIGLNRTVGGAVAGTAGRDRLDLVARDDDGALLHFRRERRRHWEGANVTERHDLGAFQLGGDPVPARAGRALHVFGRSPEGDLLHFRLGRTWKARNRTEHRRAGSRFRLAGDPVPAAGPRLRLSVVGRDPEGGLVHYDGSPLGRWRAEQVAGDPLASRPAARWVDDVLHVVGVAPGGRLIHWRWDGEAWTTTDVTTTGTGPAIRFSGAPALVVTDGRLQVFGRDPGGKLVRAAPGSDGSWRRSILAGGLTGDPAVTTGPAGIHVFAITDGGLLHAWKAGDWRSEDLVATRPTLAGADPFHGPIHGWGSPSELRLFCRRGPGPVVLTWTADADWSMNPLADLAGVTARHLPAPDTTLLVDGRGRPHLFGTDGSGTLLHVEPGAWLEPGSETRATAPLPASYRASSPARRKHVRESATADEDRPAAATEAVVPRPTAEPEPAGAPADRTGDPMRRSGESAEELAAQIAADAAGEEADQGPPPEATVGPAVEPARDRVFDVPTESDDERLDLVIEPLPQLVSTTDEATMEEPEEPGTEGGEDGLDDVIFMEAAEDPGVEPGEEEQRADEAVEPGPGNGDALEPAAAGAADPTRDEEPAWVDEEDDGLVVLDDDVLEAVENAGPRPIEDPAMGVTDADPLPLLEDPEAEEGGDGEEPDPLPYLTFEGDEDAPRFPIPPDLPAPVPDDASGSGGSGPAPESSADAGGGSDPESEPEPVAGAEEAGVPAAEKDGAERPAAGSGTGDPADGGVPELEEIDLSKLASWPPSSPSLRRKGRDKRREAS